MAIPSFSLKFKIDRVSGDYKIIVTDTPTSIVFDAANFSVKFPDGYEANSNDFNNPDIVSSGGSAEKTLRLGVDNQPLKGDYIVTYVVRDASLNTHTAIKTINLQFEEPSYEIEDLSRVVVPLIKFKDITTNYNQANFTPTSISRNLVSAYPTTSAISGQSKNNSISTFGELTLDMIDGLDYYEGLYNINLEVNISYQNDSDSGITLDYIKTYVQPINQYKAETETQLLDRINTYKGIVDSYKETNRAVYDRDIETYDLAVALYSNVVDAYKAGVTGNTQQTLDSLLEILLVVYDGYVFQSAPILPFQVTTAGLLGGGSTNKIPKFDTPTSISDSIMQEEGSTIKVDGNIKPLDETKPLVDDKDLFGGARVVADQAAMLSIPSEKATEGMLVMFKDAGALKTYQLNDISNIQTIGAWVDKSLDSHANRTDNPHQVTKAQVGLGNADNTSDVDKPVSNLQAAAINSVQDNLNTHVADGTNPHNVTAAQLGVYSQEEINNFFSGLAPIVGYEKTNWDSAYAFTSSFDITDYYTSLDGVYEKIINKGAANGYAPLDSGAKIPLVNLPDSLVGQVRYEGTWDANNNNPLLTDPPAANTKGHYYVCSSDGNQFGLTFQTGDWIISNGTEWEKVDNTDAVTSVFGRLGSVLATEGDYQSFYPRLSQVYSNPTWIGDLDRSKINYEGTSSQFVKGDGTLDSKTYALSSDIPTDYVPASTGGTFSGNVTVNGLTASVDPIDAQGDLRAQSNLRFDAYAPTSGHNLLEVGTDGTVFILPKSDIALQTDLANYYLANNPDGYISDISGFTTSDLTEGSNLYFTNSRARASLSFLAGSGDYNSSTGVITIPTNNNQITNGEGYISNISGFTTSDLSEGTNLYFTNSRARASLSFLAGSGAYNSSTGVITIPTNNTQITNGAGYITSASLANVAYTNVDNDFGVGQTINGDTTINGNLSVDSVSRLNLGTNAVPNTNGRPITLFSSNRAFTGSASNGGSFGLTIINPTISSGDNTAGINFRSLSSAASGLSGYRLDNERMGLRFYTHPTNVSTDPVILAMEIEPSGNVGIGKTPEAGVKLDVNGTATIADSLFIKGTAPVLCLTPDSTTGVSEILFGDSTDTDSGEIRYSNFDHSMTFRTNAREALRLDSLGQVIIGSNTPMSTAGTAFKVTAWDANSFFRLGNNTANTLDMELMRWDDVRMFFVDGNSGDTTIHGDVSVNSLAGIGNRIIIADSNGVLGDAVIGSGLDFDGTTLTASGGGSGSIGGSGTSGKIAKFTDTSEIGDSIITETSGAISVAGTISATGGNSTEWNASYDRSPTALDYNTSTGVISLTRQNVSGFAAAITLAPFNTGNLIEGTNLYYTTSRARSAISGGTGITYDDSTGVISLTDTGYITGVTAGTGLSGGGTQGTVTLNVSGLTVSQFSGAAIQLGSESFVDSDTVLMTAAAVQDKILSYGYTTNVGDITGVSAGSYLTGGGTSGTITLNVNATTASTGSTIVARDSSGDINVRLLRSEYDSTNPSIGFIMTQVDTDSNNYVRPSTPAQFRAAVTDGVYYPNSNPNGYTSNVGDITGVTAGSGLAGGGSSGSVTLSHADTSSQGSVNNSGRTYIQDITLDTYGHITGITSATETVVNTTNFNIQANGGTQVNISAGEEINFINGNATTVSVANQANPTVRFNHADTSSQGSVNNSGNTVIQDITLDTYGHVTGINSATISVPTPAILSNGSTPSLNSGITGAEIRSLIGAGTGSGTVTSVAMTVPTGLSISGSPITSSGTLAVGLQSGYSIPTTSSQSNWNTAYGDKVNSASFNTGNGVLTLSRQDGGSVTVDLDGRYVTSGNTDTDQRSGFITDYGALTAASGTIYNILTPTSAAVGNVYVFTAYMTNGQNNIATGIYGVSTNGLVYTIASSPAQGSIEFINALNIIRVRQNTGSSVKIEWKYTLLNKYPLPK